MRAFDAIMRVLSSLIGLAVVALGGVWILQGLNLAFRVGFMVGQRQWVLYGAIVVLIGIAQIVWSNIRSSPTSSGSVTKS
jgi:drug/metabolite transporter superfamily protein YnfA